jgi:DNA-binding response OmpR family regulator
MSRILVVNDEPDLVDICEVVLERAGHQVHTLVDAKLVLERAIALRPDLVIVDWVLATHDARDVLLALRTEPVTANTPVLLMSAFPGASQNAKLYAFDGFLAKPFSAETLVTTVNATLRRHGASCAARSAAVR